MSSGNYFNNRAMSVSALELFAAPIAGCFDMLRVVDLLALSAALFLIGLLTGLPLGPFPRSVYVCSALDTAIPYIPSIVGENSSEPPSLTKSKYK